jgi:hypothetical protein
MTMSRLRILLVALLALSATAADAQSLFDNSNIYGVNNGGSSPVFTLQAPASVSQIQTYHWNFGRGARPGTITLRHQSGQTFGPFGTIGTSGHNNAPNVNWVANVGSLTLPAGSYTVYDSDPSTWSHNPQSGSRGFVRVFGAHTGGQPAPAPAPRLPTSAPFGSPIIDNYRLGQCFRGSGQFGSGSDCGGQTSADAFCRLKGFSRASSFRTQATTQPTKAIGDGTVCTVPPSQASYLRCFTFEFVICGR